MKLYTCSAKTKRLKVYQKIPVILGLGLVVKTTMIFQSCMFVSYSSFKATQLFFMTILCGVWPHLFKSVKENSERIVEHMSLMEDGQNVHIKYING